MGGGSPAPDATGPLAHPYAIVRIGSGNEVTEFLTPRNGPESGTKKSRTVTEKPQPLHATLG